MRMRITVEGRAYEVEVEVLDEAGGGAPAPAAAAPTQAPGPRPASAPPPPPAQHAASSATGDLPSPLAGNVVRVAVKNGDQVKAGDTILVLEAMKMESAVTAPGDAAIAQVLVNAGDSVKAGQALVKFG